MRLCPFPLADGLGECECLPSLRLVGPGLTTTAWLQILSQHPRLICRWQCAWYVTMAISNASCHPFTRLKTLSNLLWLVFIIFERIDCPLGKIFFNLIWYDVWIWRVWRRPRVALWVSSANEQLWSDCISDCIQGCISTGFCIAGDSDALDLLFSNLCLFVCCNCFQIYLHLQIMLRSGSARNGPLFASDATTAECFTTKALASLSTGHWLPWNDNFSSCSPKLFKTKTSS